jgi:hypothetical protein
MRYASVIPTYRYRRNTDLYVRAPQHTGMADQRSDLNLLIDYVPRWAPGPIAESGLDRR